jgi:AAHS family 4-hydroxybenzoate transporter-like MFS transporter
MGGVDPKRLLPALLAGVAAAGLAINAVQIGMYAVSAHIYPTACRSSGVGWALGVGRLGGILSSFGGALLLAQGGSRTFFGGIAVALVLTCASLLMIRNHLPAARDAH